MQNFLVHIRSRGLPNHFHLRGSPRLSYSFLYPIRHGFGNQHDAQTCLPGTPRFPSLPTPEHKRTFCRFRRRVKTPTVPAALTSHHLLDNFQRDTRHVLKQRLQPFQNGDIFAHASRKIRDYFSQSVRLCFANRIYVMDKLREGRYERGRQNGPVRQLVGQPIGSHVREVLDSVFLRKSLHASVAKECFLDLSWRLRFEKQAFMTVIID